MVVNSFFPLHMCILNNRLYSKYTKLGIYGIWELRLRFFTITIFGNIYHTYLFFSYVLFATITTKTPKIAPGPGKAGPVKNWSGGVRMGDPHQKRTFSEKVIFGF